MTQMVTVVYPFTQPELKLIARRLAYDKGCRLNADGLVIDRMVDGQPAAVDPPVPPELPNEGELVAFCSAAIRRELEVLVKTDAAMIAVLALRRRPEFMPPDNAPEERAR